jgi:hypothetical protein
MESKTEVSLIQVDDNSKVVRITSPNGANYYIPNEIWGYFRAFMEAMDKENTANSEK